VQLGKQKNVYEIFAEKLSEETKWMSIKMDLRERVCKDIN
jgi:hypothetical protein